MQTQSQLPPETPTWHAIVRLLRWDKPAGRLILMVPALWAVVLAGRGTPPWLLVGIIILGSLVTSAAGCVVNDLWDRDIDPQVARTRQRPLASRQLSGQVGLVVAFLAFACAYGLTYFLNPLTFWLSVAAVPVIVFYPLAKRFFPIPQLVLALAWGFAVLISWTAVTAKLEPATWLLWGATVLWTLGFDTIYAMADREDDRRIGIHSSARFFGPQAPHAVGLFFLGTVALLVALGIVWTLNWTFWIALGVALVTWERQHRLLARTQMPPAFYGQLFRQNVWLGFGLLAGMVLGQIDLGLGG